MSQRVLSGIQPTGDLTLGNYLGALKRFVEYQETHDAFYCVVDLHAITVRQNPQELRDNTYNLVAAYIACGLNPKKATLFVQSHVREHSELAWLLSTFTQMGELERMTQFKDKSVQHKTNINAGLFTYPCLQAADILLYQPHGVPVGEDQKQHLELTRNIAERFNGAYDQDTFRVPEVWIPKIGARVKDLQNPLKKMSKSLPGKGCILLIDTPKQIEKKIKSAVTDDEACVRLDEKNQPGVANLLGIYAACKSISIEAAAKEFEGMEQYGPFKQAVADAVVSELEPIQARYQELLSDKAELDRILAEGAAKARTVAARTVLDAKKAIGFVLPA